MHYPFSKSMNPLLINIKGVHQYLAISICTITFLKYMFSFKHRRSFPASLYDYIDDIIQDIPCLLYCNLGKRKKGSLNYTVK